MKHIVSYSGGKDSFANAVILRDKHGANDLYLIFCDTLVEDCDLYRFLIEGACKIYNHVASDTLWWFCNNVPELKIGNERNRKYHLINMHWLAHREMPNYRGLIDGRDPWEVFVDSRYAGNTRHTDCNIELKGKPFRNFIEREFDSDEISIYMGFDWSEPHRLKNARKNYKEYKVESPIAEHPFSKGQLIQMIDDEELDLPRMYEQMFSHNNCSGGCVKAGQGHWINMLNNRPQDYAYFEFRQRKMVEENPNLNHPFLRVTINKQLHYMTLEEFRKHTTMGGQYDLFDIGGCGCFGELQSTPQ